MDCYRVRIGDLSRYSWKPTAKSAAREVAEDLKLPVGSTVEVEHISKTEYYTVGANPKLNDAE